MHDIQPFHKWRDQYAGEEDMLSPFHGSTYNTEKVIYNYVIHPYWDDFGSETLYLKIIFADYETGQAVIELIGEWNDAIQNDIMEMKRHVMEPLIDEGITRFILICENVLNFHASDDCYYEEWSEECRDGFNGGWITFLNTFDHVAQEMDEAHLDNYVYYGANFNGFTWRIYQPKYIFEWVEARIKDSSRKLK